MIVQGVVVAQVRRRAIPDLVLCDRCSGSAACGWGVVRFSGRAGARYPETWPKTSCRVWRLSKSRHRLSFSPLNRSPHEGITNVSYVSTKGKVAQEKKMGC